MLSDLRAREDEMLAALATLVRAESPSGDPIALAGCAEEIALLAARLGLTGAVGTIARVGDADAPALRLDVGDGPRRVLLLGHYDTVWPVGTLARMPFAVRDGRAHGPGGFDMKAGIVQGLFALAALPDATGATVLLTADEETGSERSIRVIEEVAREVEAVLVLEPSAAGALKTARKGVTTYELAVTGRAAHAGLEPEAGANAALALAHLTIEAARAADGLPGTTVTPTVAAAGGAINVVPDRATLTLDVRTVTARDQDTVAERLAALRSPIAGTAVAVRAVQARPPLEPEASAGLFARATAAAVAVGLPAPTGVAVGGGSDGSLTAALGVPTLDGLGAVGGGAHAADEHVEVARMPERAALVAALVADLLTDPRADAESPADAAPPPAPEPARAGRSPRAPTGESP